MEKHKLVTAIANGYYNGYRVAGTSFHVPAHEKASWFHAEGEEPLKIERVLHNVDVKNSDERLIKENASLKERLDSMERFHENELKGMKHQLKEMAALVEAATSTPRTDPKTDPKTEKDKAPKK